MESPLKEFTLAVDGHDKAWGRLDWLKGFCWTFLALGGTLFAFSYYAKIRGEKEAQGGPRSGIAATATSWSGAACFCLAAALSLAFTILVREGKTASYTMRSFSAFLTLVSAVIVTSAWASQVSDEEANRGVDYDLLEALSAASGSVFSAATLLQTGAMGWESLHETE